jgi:hypothetical protein
LCFLLALYSLSGANNFRPPPPPPPLAVEAAEAVVGSTDKSEVFPLPHPGIVGRSPFTPLTVTIMSPLQRFCVVIRCCCCCDDKT